MPTARPKFDPRATTAPQQACTFVREAAVTFADGDGENQGFHIVGYSGEIIRNHWYWGDVAFDLEGLKFAGKKVPVLDSHYTARRLGFGRGSIDDQVVVEGRFLSNAQAQEFRQDMKDGFPMQASLYCPPSVVERVEKGASTQVNGRTLKGPGAVFRKATIQEVSMCVFGADGKTSATAFAANTDNPVTFTVKETMMPQEHESIEEATLTVDQLKSQFAAVHTEVFEAGKAEGVQAERGRFTTLEAACGDDTELLVQCFTEGKGEVDALKLRNERLAAQLTETTKHAPGKKTEPSTDPAITEFREQVPGQRARDEGKPASFMEAVAQYQAEHGVKESDAIEKCVDLYPDLHAQMTQGGA